MVRAVTTTATRRPVRSAICHAWAPWLVLCLAAGCASTRAVRPLRQGVTEVSAGAGGPLSRDYGHANPPPIPMLTLGARHGLSARADGFVNLHAGALVFGLTWIDAGAAIALWPCEPTAVCLLASGATHALVDSRAVMLLQQLTGVLSVRRGAFTPYLGWDSVVSVVPAWDHMPIVFAGLRGELGRWFAQVETRWYAPWSDGERSTMHYLSPFGAGALGVSLAVGGAL